LGLDHGAVKEKESKPFHRSLVHVSNERKGLAEKVEMVNRETCNLRKENASVPRHPSPHFPDGALFLKMETRGSTAKAPHCHGGQRPTGSKEASNASRFQSKGHSARKEVTGDDRVTVGYQTMGEEKSCEVLGEGTSSERQTGWGEKKKGPRQKKKDNVEHKITTEGRGKH